MGSEEKKIASTYTVNRYMGGVFPDEYKNYIRTRWMRSYRHANDYIKLIDQDSYFPAYTYYLTLLMLKPEAMLRIAVLTYSPDVVLGFSVCRGAILDYVFVGKDYRKIGIATKLIPADIETFTHLTKTGMKLWPTKMPNAKFNPFA